MRVLKILLGTIGVLVVGVVVVALLGEQSGSARPPTCQELSTSIVELSKKSTNPFAAKIVKLYEIRPYEPKGAGRAVDCRAEALWDRGGDKSTIEFHLMEPDADGDQTYGYAPVP